MWQKKTDGLYKKFEFGDFDSTVFFVNKLFEIAKNSNHHPTIKTTYTVVEVWLLTHDKADITDKDHSFVQQIDKLLSGDSVAKQNDDKAAELYTDGGSRGNPGPSAIGAVILDKDKNQLAEISEYIGETTNNQAEYRALEAGLKKVIELGISEVVIFMDSELIINQINGKYKVKKTELIPLYQSVKKLSENFDQVSFEHVRRENNVVADGLVNKALDARAG